MKNHKVLLLTTLLLPWLTIPLLGKGAFKKYVPAAIFICTFTKALDIFGENKKWWRFYKGIAHLNSMNFFNLGPYFITSIWMLKFTFGKFPMYLITNFVLHLCFIYLGGLKSVSRFRLFTLDKLSKFQYLGINTLRAFLLYAFQYLMDVSANKKPLLTKSDCIFFDKNKIS